MNGLFLEVWAGKDAISVDNAVELTLPVWAFKPVSDFSIHTNIFAFLDRSLHPWCCR